MASLAWVCLVRLWQAVSALVYYAALTALVTWMTSAFASPGQGYYLVDEHGRRLPEENEWAPHRLPGTAIHTLSGTPRTDTVRKGWLFSAHGRRASSAEADVASSSLPRSRAGKAALLESAAVRRAASAQTLAVLGLGGARLPGLAVCDPAASRPCPVDAVAYKDERVEVGVLPEVAAWPHARIAWLDHPRSEAGALYDRVLANVDEFAGLIGGDSSLRRAFSRRGKPVVRLAKHGLVEDDPVAGLRGLLVRIRAGRSN